MTAAVVDVYAEDVLSRPEVDVEPDDLAGPREGTIGLAHVVSQ